MEPETTKVGKGILEQIKLVREPHNKKLTFNIIEDFLKDVFKANDVPRESFMLMGSHIIYGSGCRTLNQVHYAHLSAIRQAKFIFNVTGIKQRVEFKYNPNDFSKLNRKPRTRRRSKKH